MKLATEQDESFQPNRVKERHKDAIRPTNTTGLEPREIDPHWPRLATGDDVNLAGIARAVAGLSVDRTGRVLATSQRSEANWVLDGESPVQPLSSKTDRDGEKTTFQLRNGCNSSVDETVNESCRVPWRQIPGSVGPAETRVVESASVALRGRHQVTSGIKPNCGTRKKPGSEAFVNTLRRDYIAGADLSCAAVVLEPIPTWLADYNAVAPHSALGYRSPREYRAMPATVAT